MSNLPFVEIIWPDRPAMVNVLSTTRQGGVSTAPYGDGQGGGGLNLGTHVGDDSAAVAHNRSLVRQHLPTEPIWLTQVHGTRVLHADTTAESMPQSSPASAPESIEADACIATRAGVVCTIMTADCMPVLLADSQGRAVGAAHAGWRGLAAGVLQQTVNAMRRAGADEISAWLGPGIGPQAFEVGADVLAAFSLWGDSARAAFVPLPDQPGKYLADLPALARLALASVGVQRVSGGEHCTVSDTQRFYSFRRERTTGRMASMIWLS